MFGKDESGGVIVAVAVTLPAIIVGVAGAIEASRAVSFRQQLRSAVELSCNQSAIYVNARKLQDVTETSKDLRYPTEVTDIVARNFTAKHIPGTPPIPVNTDTNVHVEATRSMSLIFGSLLRTPSLTFKSLKDCAVLSTKDALSNSTTAPVVVFRESFEGAHSISASTGTGWGVMGGYNNANTWNGWTTTGAGVEIDSQRGIAVSKVLFGSYFAELDSDCKTSANTGNKNCKSNSTLARTANLTPGTYQIRYWYISRQQDSSVGTKVICGAKDSDVAYYTKDGQTNRIEVFFERKGNYTYNLNNLVDVCVMSNQWVERVISLKVTAADEYRFSWRAAGREDTYGGLIDNLRICRNYCPAT